jgi:hypothetical protein
VRCMRNDLRADLKRLEGLAFGRVADCRELVEKYHAVGAGAKGAPDYACLEKLYAWAFVPLSLWPVDIRGFGLHVLKCVAEGREVDAEARLKCRFLQEAPSERICRMVGEYEHSIKMGSYESLIEAQHKFDLMEWELGKNPELKADWEEIKKHFDVSKHQNPKGVIRRRMVQERNFRPADWKFSWEKEGQRFQNVFDAFCHKWDLYGMEGDKPLLLKLTVNMTPYGTIIMIPRYWSFDPKRDLKWGAITRLHRTRSAQKQGPKFSLNLAERRQEATRAKELWDQAAKAGLKGDRRNEWVMNRLGWVPGTDESRLRRLVKTLRRKP